MFYQKKNNKLEPLTGSTLYADSPIGTVIASFLAVAPSGYIKCDDTVYTKANYPELYERIPDVFKDTTNETFTIDLREVALKGIGLSSLTTEHYSSTGLTLGEFIEDQLQNHRHPDTSIISVSSSGMRSGLAIGSSNGNTGSGGQVGSDYRSGNTTEVKSVGVNYFIKAKHVALPIDIMDAVSEVYATKEYVDEEVISNLSRYYFIANNGSIDIEIPKDHSILLFGWKSGTSAFAGVFGNYATGFGSYISIVGAGSFTITRVDATHVTITNTSGANVNLTIMF